ncbi:MAG TPA: HAD-IB family hydrolase [Bacteroides sp.]|nr:HAD-IB family hydrolase [Bacteroides sp.]
MTLRKRYSYIAFYDLDRTIFTGNSATSLVAEARNRGIMNGRQFRHALYLSLLYKLDWQDPARIITRMLTWLKGMTETAARQLCLEVFENNLRQTIRPEITREMQKHRDNLGANVLLSSATSLICEPVAAHLNLEDVICTRLEANNGILTGATRGKLVYGREKKTRLTDYCRKEGHKPAESYYYGDSKTDVYVMETVGHPVAVCPDQRLLEVARKRDWRVLEVSGPSG